MMPNSLCEILSGYEQRWFRTYENQFDERSDTVSRFKKLLVNQEAPFSRDTFPGHFTASCFVVDPQFSHILLLKHRKLGKWLQMGGHCDGEINFAEVALREAQEETGSEHIEILEHQVIDLDIHRIPKNNKEEEHEHFDVRFLGVCKKPEQLERSERECSDLQWFSWDKALQVTHEESMLRVFRKIHFLLEKGALS